MTPKDKIKLAIKKGYYNDDSGNIFSKRGKLKLYSKNNYLGFSIKHLNRNFRIPTHRFIAYILYGDIIFELGIQVRHLDGNSLNNTSKNINYGTCSQNHMDKPKLTRQITAKFANKKHSDELIKSLKIDREGGLTYKQLGQKYNLCKSTLSYYLTVTGKKKEVIL
jgi:hypothetical protein